MDRGSRLHTVGGQEVKALFLFGWTKLMSRHDWSRQEFFNGSLQGKLEVEGHLSLSHTDTSKANVWFRATMHWKPLATRELFSSSREVDETHNEMRFPC